MTSSGVVLAWGKASLGRLGCPPAAPLASDEGEFYRPVPEAVAALTGRRVTEVMTLPMESEEGRGKESQRGCWRSERSPR